MKGILLIPAFLVVITASGQRNDSISSRNQVIKLVMTSNVIYPGALIISYERIMRPFQTLNITGGAVSFPKVFGNTDAFVVTSDKSRTGFMACVDYRFYLKKENRFATPHGVYIAPFFSYFQFNNERMLRASSSAPGTETPFTTEIKFSNIGFQIGYQFVIHDRWTFDFVFFGPSMTNYTMNLDLSGSFTLDQENAIINEILGRFPLLKDLIDNKSLTLHGKNSTWAPGYRFTGMVGYKFGFKKK